VAFRRRDRDPAAPGKVGPTVRLEEEWGGWCDEPSSDQLCAALDELVRGERPYVLVERPQEESRFVQALIEYDAFRVEHCDGGPERHFWCATSDAAVVHRVFVHWAYDLSGWREALPWQPLR
jgi:hypothetical protein